MSLPNLSNLCMPCGVTNRKFSILFPGLSLAPGQPEIVLDEADYECKICLTNMNYPAAGFRQSDGDVFKKQTEFSKLSRPTQDQKDYYNQVFTEAAEKIRTSDPKRTQIELLFPGCGHQVHRQCLIGQVTMTEGGRSDKCPQCMVLIDTQILASLRSEAESLRGVVRQRGAESPRVVVRQRGAESPNPAQVPPNPVAEDTAQVSPFREYHDGVQEWIRNVRGEIGRLPDYNVVEFAKGALDRLQEAVQMRLRELGFFPPSNSAMHRKWDNAIGDILVSQYAMRSFLLYDASVLASLSTDHQQGFQNVESFLKALIRKLVPPANTDAYMRVGTNLSTSWFYKGTDSGLIAGAYRSPLQMERASAHNGRTGDERLRPVFQFLRRLSNVDLPYDHITASFVLLTSWFISVAVEALLDNRIEELQAFDENIYRYYTLLFEYDFAILTIEQRNRVATLKEQLNDYVRFFHSQTNLGR